MEVPVMTTLTEPMPVATIAGAAKEGVVGGGASSFATRTA